MDFIEQHVGV